MELHESVMFLELRSSIILVNEKHKKLNYFLEFFLVFSVKHRIMYHFAYIFNMMTEIRKSSTN